jgi:hypothetical protein
MLPLSKETETHAFFWQKNEPVSWKRTKHPIAEQEHRLVLHKQVVVFRSTAIVWRVLRNTPAE